MHVLRGHAALETCAKLEHCKGMTTKYFRDPRDWRRATQLPADVVPASAAEML
jgi:hypothetical protein